MLSEIIVSKIIGKGLGLRHSRLCVTMLSERRFASVQNSVYRSCITRIVSRMNWSELCNDTSLENVPYRIELERNGQLLMSPHRSYHSVYQSRIIRHLNLLLANGEAMPECPIEVKGSTLVADVAWASPDLVRRNFDLPSWTESPEIVVEVLSPCNAVAEIRKKRSKFFSIGAREFWLCRQDGSMEFFGPRGRIPTSRVCPGFPKSVATPGD